MAGATSGISEAFKKRAAPQDETRGKHLDPLEQNNFYDIVYNPEQLKALLNKPQGYLRGDALKQAITETMRIALYSSDKPHMSFIEFKNFTNIQKSLGHLLAVRSDNKIDLKAIMKQSGLPEVSEMDFVQYSALRRLTQTLEEGRAISSRQKNEILNGSPFSSTPAKWFSPQAALTKTGHNYNHLDPDGTFKYAVKNNETAQAIAERFHPAIGGATVKQSLEMLMAQNRLSPADASKPLPSEKSLYIPVKQGYEIVTRYVEKGASLWSLTREFNNKSLLDPALGASLNSHTVNNIARLNGINPDASLPLKTPLYFSIRDDYAHIAPVPKTASTGNNSTLLVTNEPASTHHEAVYEVAASVTKAIDPHDDLLDVYSFRTNKIGEFSPQFHELVAGAVQRGQDVVMNFSIQNTGGHIYANDLFVADSLASLKGRGEVSFFAAAGNLFDLLGPYTAASVFGQVDNSVMVGAARRLPDGTKELEHYSSSNADLLAPPLPDQDGKPLEGTSFASPYMAALFRKMNERYGETLSHTEIMAAAYLSTDLDIRAPKKGDHLKFYTNSGGRPYHSEAGAGMIVPELWAENLEKMTVMKRSLDHKAGHIARNIDLAAITPRHIQASGQYEYKIPVPADMTLDRLTIHAPFDKNEWLLLKSPNGFTTILPPATTHIHTTSALALEDVRQGDHITLVTNAPLDKSAYIRIRGYEDGNAIQLLRDTVNRWQPNAMYRNNKLNESVEMGMDQVREPGKSAPDNSRNLDIKL